MRFLSRSRWPYAAPCACPLRPKTRSTRAKHPRRMIKKKIQGSPNRQRRFIKKRCSRNCEGFVVFIRKIMKVMWKRTCFIRSEFSRLLFAKWLQKRLFALKLHTNVKVYYFQCFVLLNAECFGKLYKSGLFSFDKGKTAEQFS